MIRWGTLLLVTLMLAACGGSGQKNMVENPYAERMKELTRNGVVAMQRERWLPAQNLFERALQTAQLSNHPLLIAQAWYNLGTLHLSSGHHEKGEAALLKSAEIAERHDLKLVALRTQIALALIDQKRGVVKWQPESIPSSMPLDMHLSFARLAQLQGRYDVSERAYAFVLGKKYSDRSSMLYKVEAHMGLALLAEQKQDYATAMKESKSVLALSKEVGAPREAAHALMLIARLEKGELAEEDSLEDALAIYRALEDRRGEKEALAQLVAVAEQRGDTDQVELLMEQLQKLEKD